MSENIQFDSDEMEIRNDGKVEGMAFIGRIPYENEEYDIMVSISSYEYEDNNENVKMNHVPHIVVSKPNGEIVKNPSARDSQIAEKAIENAKVTAKYVAKNIGEFVE